ncbi:MAG: hypothetical protein AAFR66_18920 [Bacteroidota bacterium]
MRPRLIPEIGMQGIASIEHTQPCDKVFINPFAWLTIPRTQRAFILEHELAHCEHGVYDEIEADTIAFQNYTAAGGRPADAIAALTENLNLHNPLSQQRIANLKGMTGNNRSYFDIGALQAAEAARAAQQMQQASMSEGDKWWMDSLDLLIENAPEILASINGRGFQPVPTDGFFPQQRQNNSILWIGLGVVLLLVVLVLLRK